MESKAYWANRFKILENSTYTDTKKAYEEITKVFDKSKKDIQSKIDVWLTRLADNNNVSYEKAKEMLSSKELKEFKWDVEDYIKYGEENGLNQEWMKELENASARHHIDKLTALKTSLQAEYEKIYGKDEEITKKTIESAYVNRYNHTAYEIQKGFNIGFNLGEIDHNKLDKLIKKPWASDGSNFSDRIWTKKSQMVDTLYQEMTRNLISEKPLKEVIETMTQYVDKSVSNAKNVAARLVMTESAYFASEGQKSCFKDLGVEEYEIVATLDDKTSDICQNMDGQHFKMSEYRVGETAPPFHVWCRSTTAPYFNDEFTKDDLRTARNGSGKTYYVPSSIKYIDWKKQLDKNREEEYNTLIGVKTKDNKIITGFVEHFAQRAIERNVAIEDIKNALEEPIYIDTKIKYNEKGEPSIAYNGDKAVVQINPDDNYLITVWKMGQHKLKSLLRKIGKKKDD